MVDATNINEIRLFPNAFRTKEELIRTIIHEKTHVEQYRLYGTGEVIKNPVRFETEACNTENAFIERLKKERKL